MVNYDAYTSALLKKSLDDDLERAKGPVHSELEEAEPINPSDSPVWVIGTVIFVAYLSSLCQSPLHTATQYALLAALSAVGRTYLSAGAGYVAQATGWPTFFALSVLVAVPSLILLAWLQRRGHFETLKRREPAAA